MAYNIECAGSYLFHRAHGIHLVNLRPQTLDLYADVGALLNDLLAVVGPLWWSSVCVEFNISGDHLLLLLVDGYVHAESGEFYAASYECL
jgi:hypothetical protein